MIKYNNNTINDWNFDTSNVIKVYRNNAIVFYKISGESPTPEYKVCFAVVDDISQYTDREFEDVYDKASDKWYKLNNLNQYEEYGVYGSGRNITTYKGKLTIDDASSSRLPAGYTEVEYVENPSMAYINSGFKPNQDTRILFTFKFEKSQSASMLIGAGGWDRADGMLFDYEQNLTGTLHISWGGTTSWSVVSSVHGDYNVHTYDWNKNEFYLDNTLVDSTTYRTFQCSDNLGIFSTIQYPYSPFGQQHFACGRLYDFKIYDNGTLVRDFVPCIRDNDSMVGMYDLVNDVFYYPPNYQSYQLVAGELVIEPTKTYEYEWNGSSWVNVGEVTGSTATLPDVPFTVNYNAKNYDASTQTFAKTNGQLADTNVIISGGTLTAHDGYVTVSSNSRGVISSYPTYFNRTNSTPNLTIISKQRTEGNNCHMFANRGTNYNWMYRPYSNKLTLHGGSEQGSIAVTTQPVIESVRVDSNRLATYNNYTNNTTSTQSNFSYGSTNGSVALFAGHTSNTGEWFIGDFYWIYMSQTTLTDAQVQEVINYNEGGGESEYPKYYSEKSDPLDDLTFNTLAEAQTYAYNNCVYDGMRAIIDGDRYYFDSSDENGWVKITEHYDELEYIQCGNGTTTTNGGLQLLTNATADYYFEVEAQWITRSSSPMLVGEKSDVEVVSYQLGLCYYSGMFLDYGGGRLNTNIDSTTQNQRHTYGAGHISGSSNPNVVGLKLDGVVQNTTNATTRVEGLPYLVGCGVRYTGHSASDVKVQTNEIQVVKLYSVKIYKDYGDTLVGDYIPVINSDNVVTLYDKVSGNYATPYGTLIAGPKV